MKNTLLTFTLIATLLTAIFGMSGCSESASNDTATNASADSLIPDTGETLEGEEVVFGLNTQTDSPKDI